MMDPNRTLTTLREVAQRIGTDAELVEDAAVVATLVLSLDSWLSRGGRLPDQWLGRPVPIIDSTEPAHTPQPILCESERQRELLDREDQLLNDAAKRGQLGG
jgi:hypothetical protein